ncbi:MAG TPA: SCO family protein [Steroidobacteraceae bacterium]|jgi:protein SCO1/2|nr:SCO family protein [Steroidobacteraceae bacterium]
MKRSAVLLLAATLLLAAAAGAWLSAWTFQAAPLQFGTRIDPAQPLPATQLVSQSGAPFDRSALEGHWSLMFFGFTHCPGICPMTLTTLAQVRKQLGGLPNAELPQVVLVSVDPERDTPERLAGYVARFDPTFTGVTGSGTAIDEFTAALGIAHKKVGAGEDYMIDHTAAIIMVDPQGRRAAVFSPPFTTERLAADYLRMLGRS